MGLTTYIFILFGISIAFYFLGYQPLLFSLLQCPTGATSCNPDTNYGYTVLNNILTAIINNPAIIGLAGVGLVITGLLAGGSFAVMYLIPIMILFAISNFLLMPTDFLLSSAMPTEIKLIVFGFMNLLLLLTIVTFIRGGE